MTPALRSERLTLLPYTASMVTGRHVDWLNDPEAMRYSEQRHKRHTLESQHTYLNEFPIGSHIWLIRIANVIANATGPDIGTITAYIDQPNNVANMGILIGRQFRDYRYGIEAWKCVMDWLFAHGVRKIEAGYAAGNESMAKLAQRAGMQVEAVQPQHFLMGGKRVSLVHCGAYRR